MDSQNPEAPQKTLSRGHHRHTSSQRPIVTRRSTRGPLDLDDGPLSVSASDNLKSPTGNNLQSPISPPPLSASRSRSRSPAPPSPLPPASPSTHPIPVSALTHLLRPSLFHPLPPAPVAYALPPPSTPISSLLAAGHFRAATLLSARFLSSPPNAAAPLNTPAIFGLWHVRLSTLCLLGLEHIAADESRVLGDVIDGPVYKDPRDGESALPWSFRVLVVRLQARVEGDVGRAVVSCYSLAREARRRAKIEGHEIWGPRLRDLEVRIAGLLVDIGDLEGAARMLEGMRKRAASRAANSSEENSDLTAGRLALVYLHVGNVEGAKAIVDDAVKNVGENSYAATLKPLIEAAEGDYEQQIANQKSGSGKESTDSGQMQNLAVCLMYSGRLHEAKQVLQELVEKRDQAFPTLLFNLTTMFELSTDKAKDLKLSLGKKLVQRGNMSLGVESSVADLKL